MCSFTNDEVACVRNYRVTCKEGSDSHQRGDVVMEAPQALAVRPLLPAGQHGQYALLTHRVRLVLVRNLPAGTVSTGRAVGGQQRR